MAEQDLVTVAEADQMGHGIGGIDDRGRAHSVETVCPAEKPSWTTTGSPGIRSYSMLRPEPR
ncbi:hypothetical protein GCM10009591_32190 [Brachybacterium tyrofermentans]